MGPMGELIVGSKVPMEGCGRAKIVKMIASAIRQCLDLVPDESSSSIPLILNLAEEERPGRVSDLGENFYGELKRALGFDFHIDTKIVQQGRVGGAVAIDLARRLLYNHGHAPKYVLVAGVDSYLDGPTLAPLIERDRVLNAVNSDGFVPGEAGAAVLVAKPAQSGLNELLCLGIGFGTENAKVDSAEPLLAAGLTRAISAALIDASLGMDDIDFRLADVSGEQYGFKESALAVARTLRTLKNEFDIWHPADCIGEVGAAALPCMLSVAIMGARSGYLPGASILCHLGNDDGKRAALVLHSVQGQT